MAEVVYRSSVLRCDIRDDDCPLCRFVGKGDRSPATLMRVIEVLDNELAETEQHARRLTTALVDKVGSKGG